MAAVLALFPSRSAKAVLELLDVYGVESHEPERERVQMAILTLSQGQEDKLLQFVEAAKQDYRDVLYWAEYPQPSESDGALLEILRQQWAWAFEDPTQILMVNVFGNLLVACHDGTLWRVLPEELTARKIRDDKNLLAAFDDEAFREDWFLDGVAEAALTALGPLHEGQCYAFKMWPRLGGAFHPENMYLAVMTEWLGVSGDVGRQIKDLPHGAKIRLDLMDNGQVRIVPAIQTDPAAPTYDSLAAGVRAVIGLLVECRYADLARLTQGRMSAPDIARAIEDYGNTVTACPEPIDELLDLVEVRDAARPTWSVVAPVFTREDGRSDLSLELTVTETSDGRYDVMLDNCRVR